MNHRPPEMKQAAPVKNPVSIRRDSAKMVGSHSDSVLSFIFDAQRGGQLSVHLLVREIEQPIVGTGDAEGERPVEETEKPKKGEKHKGPRTIELLPQDQPDLQGAPVALELESKRFGPGLSQKYESPAVDLSRWPIERLTFDPKKHMEIPIAVRLEVDAVEGQPQCIHYTYISLKNNGPAEDEDAAKTSPSRVRPAQIFKQKLQYGTECFVLHEVFGASSKVADAEPDGGGSDCVICLSEPRDTAVLPCRHMCFCSYCAGIVRLQCDRCPVCRQKVASLLQFKRGDPALEELRGEGQKAVSNGVTQSRKSSLAGMPSAPAVIGSTVAARAAVAASRRPSMEDQLAADDESVADWRARRVSTSSASLARSA